VGRGASSGWHWLNTPGLQVVTRMLNRGELARQEFVVFDLDRDSWFA
jgi:hypothetical protein